MKFSGKSVQQAFGLKCKQCFFNSTVATEKNKTFRIVNSTGGVVKVKSDGCLIQGNSNKCDFIFLLEDLQTVIFLELKSEDVDHAYLQIVKTIEHFNSFVKLDKEQIEGCIVSSAIPRHANLKFQNLIAKFKKEHGKNLSRHTNQCIKSL